MPTLTPDTLRQRVRARLHEQRTLVEKLLQRRELLAGSLFMRWGVCGKKGCICQTGQKHGPYYVLSRRSAGRGGFIYLDKERAGEARALEALGRLSQEAGDLESALTYYQRAAAANPNERAALRRAATLLAAADRRRQAEAQWDALLIEHPYDADAAMQLVRLRLERQAETDLTLELARRSVRFRGGPEARRLLARVHRARGEEDLAAKIEARLEESAEAEPAS